MARVWTPEQLAAIETRDRSLLVSAAAGSGKTATLTERIIRSVLDTENPIDLTDMLVVTFTNAAAGELRERIGAALKEAIKNNKSDPRLEKQLLMLGSAKIKTIDAFCNDVVRANADVLGIAPNYRIQDTAEAWLLAGNILEGMIDAVWEGELTEVATPEELVAVTDCLTDSKRTGEISEVLLYLYTVTESSTDGVFSIRRLAKQYSPDSFTTVEATREGAFAMSEAKALAEHYLALWKDFLDKAPLPEKPTEDLSPMLRADIALLESIASADSYDTLREALYSVSFVRKPSVKKERVTDFHEAVTYHRDRLKDELIKQIREKYFFYTSCEWRDLFVNIYSHLDVICRFLEKFDRLFLEEKIRRCAFEHSDIERFAYKALVGEGGEPTAAATNLKERFRAVYIDEYQDVNGLQNSIFEAVSKPDNRFMVGDIKQSIYGFRSARPDIFASLKKSYPALNSEGDFPSASIFMSNNFRCDRGVVDFVNSVFDRIFSLTGENIGYSEGDRLTFSKVYDTPPREEFTPSVCMLEKTKAITDDEDSPDEPYAVALKIKELLKSGRLHSGAPVRPSDIAIIMRSAKGRDAAYSLALKECGIPSVIAAEKSFFLNAEVLLTLCLLNSVDNPRRDIYLAGLMRSPLFDFTPDELLKLREYGGDTLYDSLKLAAREPKNKKAAAFLEKLSGYRYVAEGMNADQLLSRLYRETGLLALASRNGGRENLMLLYDFAKRYEGGTYRGLYSFISYINSVLDRRTTFDDKREPGDEDAVNIITAHGSKGLEYPIVFLVDAGKQFRNLDAAKRLAYAEDFGINFRLRTPSGLAVVDNPVHSIINAYNMKKSYEEELRILYVALTRARERLFVTGTCPTVKTADYLEGVRINGRSLSEYSARGLKSYLEIILTAGGTAPLTPEVFTEGKWSADLPAVPHNALREGDAGAELASRKDGAELSVKERVEDILSGGKKADASPEDTLTHGLAEPIPNGTPADEKEGESPDGEELAKILEERFRFEYPHKYMTELPAKLSVSALYPTVLDGTEETAKVLSDTDSDGEEKERRQGYLPAFYTGKRSDESARRGTATHTFMQFCNLENLKKNGALAELDRLCEREFLSEADKARVRVDEIEKFTRSELFSAMLSAKKLYRELRFNVRLDASHFTEEEERAEALSGEKILVQGVIDCIIIDGEGRIRLVDYKTDRLTPEELADKSLAARKLLDRHSLQLSYYALAIEQMLGKAPDSVEIYSLPLGESVGERRVKSEK